MKTQKTNGRIVRAVARALRERDRGNQHYQKSTEALEKARWLGLKVDQQVEVTRLNGDGKPTVETFALVDNFSGEKVSRAKTIYRFELRKVPKKALQEAEAAA
jgi:hypothetical protein